MNAASWIRSNETDSLARLSYENLNFKKFHDTQRSVCIVWILNGESFRFGSLNFKNVEFENFESKELKTGVKIGNKIVSLNF